MFQEDKLQGCVGQMAVGEQGWEQIGKWDPTREKSLATEELVKRD